MKRNTWFNLLMALGLVLALGGGIVMARRAQAQGPGPEGPSSIQAAVGTAFTYQGRLEDASGPVDGTCSFGLSLYGSSGDADQIGTTQDKMNVPVSNGYFTVTDLDFGASAFDGNARYLEISVDCGGGGVTLDPRVALTAAPYAHSLRPGAVIEGTSTGNILSVQNTSTSGYGVYGKSGTASGKPALFGVGVWGDGDSSVGVYGTSNSSGGVLGFSTSNSGVAGISTSGNGVDGASSSGAGVYGTAPTTGTVGIATASDGVGVYGNAHDPTDYTTSIATGVWGNTKYGYGVLGTSDTAIGVYGRSSSSYGVYGYSSSEYGVYGNSGSGNGVEGASSSGTGVYGTAPTTGTVGIATASGGKGVYGYSASGHGVHGKANPPDGYGIYSEGNAYVEGKLSWDAKTSYVAVAMSAFIPELYGDIGHVEYTNEGFYLVNEDADWQWYTAQAQLPHGATVKELRVGWRDGSDETATLRLRRRSMLDVTQGPENMAEVSSVGALGGVQRGVWSDDTIAGDGVQNDSYTYYLEVRLPPTAEDIRLYGVVIEYEITQPY